MPQVMTIIEMLQAAQMVLKVGVEPTRMVSPRDFKSRASAYFATRAGVLQLIFKCSCQTLQLIS